MRNDFRLGDWIVRPHRGHIERGGEIVQIHPKAMAVLECLAAAGGEVVKRDELFDAVWPGVIVTDDALAHCVMELRKAFGDSARDAEIIRTIPKVGFCLIPPVTDATEERPVAGSRMRFPCSAQLLRGGPSVTVSVARPTPPGPDLLQHQTPSPCCRSGTSTLARIKPISLMAFPKS
jgi:DNA-binding winged helix-turn-helix (wHTH) protein